MARGDLGAAAALGKFGVDVAAQHRQRRFRPPNPGAGLRRGGFVDQVELSGGSSIEAVH